MKKLFVFILFIIISTLIVVGCSKATSSSTENTEDLGISQKFIVGYANLDDTDVVCINRKLLEL
jgi:ABC-type Fe3+-citrate transport system substrate-binding protein